MSTVMIVDDHPIVRDGLEMMMNLNPALEVVAVASDGIEGQEKLAPLVKVPDVILVDLQMPRMNGVDFIKQLQVDTRVVVLSTEIDADVVMHMAQYNVHGYLLKDEVPTQIVAEVARIAADASYVALSAAVTSAMVGMIGQHVNSVELTAKQVSLLQLVAEGLTNKEIGAKMFVTDRTVKLYLTEIYETLNVSNRAQAIAVAAKTGIL